MSMGWQYRIFSFCYPIRVAQCRSKSGYLGYCRCSGDAPPRGPFLQTEWDTAVTLVYCVYKNRRFSEKRSTARMYVTMGPNSVRNRAAELTDEADYRIPNGTPTLLC